MQWLVFLEKEGNTETEREDSQGKCHITMVAVIGVIQL